MCDKTWERSTFCGRAYYMTVAERKKKLGEEWKAAQYQRGAVHRRRSKAHVGLALRLGPDVHLLLLRVELPAGGQLRAVRPAGQRTLATEIKDRISDESTQ